jgi:ABC-type multidrug transport system ATPase subunit/pSer/pThr/pTyr-binding forkhead associated (FHA) protein
MKIILTEVRGEETLASHEFDQQIIKIGRDATLNDVVFERARWPMVSRRHAEIRLEKGDWYLIDLGSANGTLLNGKRISERTQLRTQSVIQLGHEGPELKIEFVEDEPEYAPFHTLVDVEAAQEQAALLARVQAGPQEIETPAKGADISPPEPVLDKPTPVAEAKPVGRALETRVDEGLTQAATLVCESGSPKQIGQHYLLVKERILIGRDSAADIPIEEGTMAVSRRHAEIRRQNDGSFTIVDLSFNGTLVNDQRITGATALNDRDQIQLALRGPIFRFADRAASEEKLARQTPSIAATSPSHVSRAPIEKIGMGTIFSRATEKLWASPSTDNAQFLFERTFDGEQHLSVGRDANNDIQLDGLLISKFHARFISSAQGIAVQDTGSTNGVFVNGQRVTGSHSVQPQDVVQIGPFILRAAAGKGVSVFDTRAKTRVDAVGISEAVGRESKKLLDDINLTIQPNEFVGVLGPSGAGKSLLLGALNGRRRPSNGRVSINTLELYEHVELLKQWIGYVPQDDIIHRELSVYRTLYYVARLRLSPDVPASEIDQIIAEVLDVTGLADRREVLVSQLSGGQRKRVSIAVELITKPSLIFLDEPTSGLDPATEQRMMKLFRQIAESGRTVILSTHAMENVGLLDRIALLLRGKLIFYGTPAEALDFVGTKSFLDLYNKLDAPLDAEVAKLPTLPPKPGKSQLREYERQREKIAEAVAEGWRTRFHETDLYQRYIVEPLSAVEQTAVSTAPAGHHHSIVDAFRQWGILIRRYAQVLAGDKWNLFVLFSQAPVIGGLVYLVIGKNDPRDFLYFILALVSMWFGTSLAARELVKERLIFERERMVNLRLLPYFASKLVVLSLIVTLQTMLLFGTVKGLHYIGMLYVPGVVFGLPHFLIMALTAVVGVAVGLFISSLVRTSEVATSLVPLILIPQILFAGLVTVPMGISRVIGATMPATWSFDEMKRLSTLDTLKEEGADPNGPTKGLGLYRHTKESNSENVSKARKEIEDYSKRINEVAAQPRIPGRPATTAELPVAPSIPTPLEINEDLSHYVAFKHPWGGLLFNPTILFLIVLTFSAATLVALRARDVR